MRGSCLRNGSEWHHGLLPGCGLQPVVCWWLCGLIRRAAGPWASVDPQVPNRSGAINNSLITCGGLVSDVVRRTSVQVRVRTGEPGALWLWCRAIGRQACSALAVARPREYGWDDEMRSYVFMWRYWSGWKHLRAFVCLYCVTPYIRLLRLYKHDHVYTVCCIDLNIYTPRLMMSSGFLEINLLLFFFVFVCNRSWWPWDICTSKTLFTVTWSLRMYY